MWACPEGEPAILSSPGPLITLWEGFAPPTHTHTLGSCKPKLCTVWLPLCAQAVLSPELPVPYHYQKVAKAFPLFGIESIFFFFLILAFLLFCFNIKARSNLPFCPQLS